MPQNLPSNSVLVYLLSRHAPPLNPLGTGHDYFVSDRSSKGIFRDTLCVRSAEVSATPASIIPQFQMWHREDLCAKAGSQVLKCRDIFVHDLLRP